jgi:hypothetical protein
MDRVGGVDRVDGVERLDGPGVEPADGASDVGTDAAAHVVVLSVVPRGGHQVQRVDLLNRSRTLS